MRTDDMEVETKEQRPKRDFKVKRSRGSRGKPSHKIRDERFRTDVGSKVLQVERNKIINRFPTLDDLLLQLGNLMVTADPVTLEIPTTLRGLGFAVQNAYKRITTELKRPPPISMNALFRLSLAQCQLQMIRASMTFKGVPNYYVGRQRQVQPWLNFEEEVASHPATLRAISTIIGQIGTFQHEGINYTSSVVQSIFSNPTSRVVHLPDDDESSALTSHSRKRLRSVEPMFLPDPYTTTFSNLRRTVVALSNSNTPIEIRKYYHDRSSLPGAIWTDDHILSNPNVIMPVHYGSMEMHDEFLQNDAFISILSSYRTSHMVGSLTYSGMGHRAQLASHFVENPHYTTGSIYSAHKLTDVEMALGGYGFFEMPDFPSELDPWYRDTIREMYAIRSPAITVNRLPIGWGVLFDRFSVRLIG